MSRVREARAGDAGRRCGAWGAMRVGVRARGRIVIAETGSVEGGLKPAPEKATEKEAPGKSGSLFHFTTPKTNGRLELVAQCELHGARVRQQAGVLAEGAAVGERKVQRLNIEAREVERVEHFPTELQRVPFRPRHLPSLGKSRDPDWRSRLHAKCCASRPLLENRSGKR